MIWYSRCQMAVAIYCDTILALVTLCCTVCPKQNAATRTRSLRLHLFRSESASHVSVSTGNTGYCISMLVTPLLLNYPSNLFWKCRARTTRTIWHVALRTPFAIQKYCKINPLLTTVPRSWLHTIILQTGCVQLQMTHPTYSGELKNDFWYL